MSEEYEVDDEGYNTSPEKAEDEKYRNFKEEPGDDDGENRRPEIRNSMIYTSLLVVKGMIGAGILNLPLIVKRFGIIGSIAIGFFLDFIAISVAYLLGRCKDITQRYSYAVYSKLAWGYVGSMIIKICLIVNLSTLAIVQLIVFGSVLDGLSTLIYKIENGKYFILAIAILIMPCMFQKDISGITKYAYFGIIGIGVFFASTIILFIDKYLKGETYFNKDMFYPKEDVSIDLFILVGGYYNAFTFHMGYFVYYLPLKPRNNKNMIKSTIIGSTTTTLIYLSYGIISYFIFGDKIEDSALIYLKTELDEANMKKDILRIVVVVISFISFLINASMSTMIHFYMFKSHFIGLIKFIIKKISEKKEIEKEKEPIPLVDIKDEKKEEEKKVEEVTSSANEFKEKEYLSGFAQNILTLACYIYVVIMALSFAKIIILDNFNGATVANYINWIAPCLFFLIFSWGKKYYKEQVFAVVIGIFGIILVLLYFISFFVKAPQK